MSRAWKIVKEIMSMQLHGIARGTNFIIMLFARLIQAYLILPDIRSKQLSIDTKLEIIVVSEILINYFLIFFFFTYSPVREYIQRNWKELNTKFKKLWKK